MTQAADTKARDAALKHLAQYWPEAKLGRTSNEDLVWLLDIISILEGDGKRTMAQTLERYRQHYFDTAAYSGRLSKHNGDDVAQTLAGAAPRQIIRAAELLLDLEQDELWVKYERLNPGQQRMNAGNRIRAGVKREDFDAEDVLKMMNRAAKQIREVA